ncbi:hypothetical protein R80B4_01922 [Fibrobacteres bacterium R8-0-B4]
MTTELLPIYFYFIVEKIIPLIISEYNLSEDEAIQKFYSSKLYSFLENPENGVWHYSPKLLFNLYKEELETGEIIFPEEAA